MASTATTLSARGSRVGRDPHWRRAMTGQVQGPRAPAPCPLLNGHVGDDDAKSDADVLASALVLGGHGAHASSTLLNSISCPNGPRIARSRHAALFFKTVCGAVHSRPRWVRFPSIPARFRVQDCPPPGSRACRRCRSTRLDVALHSCCNQRCEGFRLAQCSEHQATTHRKLRLRGCPLS